MALPPPGPNAHVVVTGATSGIGAALARGLSARGYPTVLVARPSERLVALADGLLDARALPADLTDDDARSRVRDVVAGDSGVVGLVNAATAVHGGALRDVASEAPEALAAMVQLHVVALHDLTTTAVRAFGPRGVGGVLNVASTGAAAPLPGNATHAAAMAFVSSFSEAVHAELVGSGVSLTTVSPGPGAAPDHVAEVGIAAMVSGRRTVVPGVLHQIGSLAGRLAPRSVLLPAVVAARRWF